MNDFAKNLIVIGLILVGLGCFMGLLGKIPGMGKLPGDILVKKGNFSFYFPLATCILISLFLTVILNLFSRK